MGMEEKKNKYQKKDKKPKSEGGDGKEEAEEKQEEEFKLPKGSVLKLTGLGGEITREDIKEVLKDECSVNMTKMGVTLPSSPTRRAKLRQRSVSRQKEVLRPLQLHGWPKTSWRLRA